MIRLLVLLIALGCAGALVQVVGAQEPPTDTPPPLEPTRTPRPDEGTLIVHVVNDLNRNGRRDADEPGLDGWRARRGCGDAFLSLGPSDASGTMVEYVRYPDDCVHIELQFGWFSTGPSSQQVHVEIGGTEELTFLVRKVGQRVHQFSGEVIVNGLPAPVGIAIDALIRTRSCGDAVFSAGTASAFYALYALSEDDRSGCARDNDGVALTVDGIVVAERSFISSWSEHIDLIAGPPPMSFNTGAPEGTAPVPYVGDIICGEARPYGGGGYYPSGFYRVYVLPDGLRAGCGAPGRVVTVRADGGVILEAPWQEGFVSADQLTFLTPQPSPVLPDAGSRPRPANDESLTLGLAALAVAASAAAVLLGWRLRRSQ